MHSENVYSASASLLKSLSLSAGDSGALFTCLPPYVYDIIIQMFSILFWYSIHEIDYYGAYMQYLEHKYSNKHL